MMSGLLSLYSEVVSLKEVETRSDHGVAANKPGVLNEENPA
jgi:hypothetical protein